MTSDRTGFNAGNLHTKAFKDVLNVVEGYKTGTVAYFDDAQTMMSDDISCVQTLVNIFSNIFVGQDYHKSCAILWSWLALTGTLVVMIYH